MAEFAPIYKAGVGIYREFNGIYCTPDAVTGHGDFIFFRHTAQPDGTLELNCLFANKTNPCESKAVVSADFKQIGDKIAHNHLPPGEIQIHEDVGPNGQAVLNIRLQDVANSAPQPAEAQAAIETAVAQSIQENVVATSVAQPVMAQPQPLAVSLFPNGPIVEEAVVEENVKFLMVPGLKWNTFVHCDPCGPYITETEQGTGRFLMESSRYNERFTYTHCTVKTCDAKAILFDDNTLRRRGPPHNHLPQELDIRTREYRFTLIKAAIDDMMKPAKTIYDNLIETFPPEVVDRLPMQATVLAMQNARKKQRSLDTTASRNLKEKWDNIQESVQAYNEGQEAEHAQMDGAPSYHVQDPYGAAEDIHLSLDENATKAYTRVVATELETEEYSDTELDSRNLIRIPTRQRGSRWAEYSGDIINEFGAFQGAIFPFDTHGCKDHLAMLRCRFSKKGCKVKIKIVKATGEILERQGAHDHPPPVLVNDLCTSEGYFRCPICHRLLMTFMNFVKHLQRKHPDATAIPATCPVCFQIFDNQVTRQDHIDLEHGVIEHLTFETDQEMFQWRAEVERTGDCRFYRKSVKKVNNIQQSQYTCAGRLTRLCNLWGCNDPCSKLHELPDCECKIQASMSPDQGVSVVFTNLHSGLCREYSIPTVNLLHRVYDYVRLGQNLYRPSVLYFKELGAIDPIHPAMLEDDLLVVLSDALQLSVLSKAGPENLIIIDTPYDQHDVGLIFTTIVLVDNLPYGTPMAQIVATCKDRSGLGVAFSEIKKRIGRVTANVVIRGFRDIVRPAWQDVMGLDDKAFVDVAKVKIDRNIIKWCRTVQMEFEKEGLRAALEKFRTRDENHEFDADEYKTNPLMSLRKSGAPEVNLGKRKTQHPAFERELDNAVTQLYNIVANRQYHGRQSKLALLNINEAIRLLSEDASLVEKDGSFEPQELVEASEEEIRQINEDLQATESPDQSSFEHTDTSPAKMNVISPKISTPVIRPKPTVVEVTTYPKQSTPVIIKPVPKPSAKGVPAKKRLPLRKDDSHSTKITVPSTSISNWQSPYTIVSRPTILGKAAPIAKIVSTSHTPDASTISDAELIRRAEDQKKALREAIRKAQAAQKQTTVVTPVTVRTIDQRREQQKDGLVATPVKRRCEQTEGDKVLQEMISQATPQKVFIRATPLTEERNKITGSIKVVTSPGMSRPRTTSQVTVRNKPMVVPIQVAGTSVGVSETTAEQPRIVVVSRAPKVTPVSKSGD